MSCNMCTEKNPCPDCLAEMAKAVKPAEKEHRFTCDQCKEEKVYHSDFTTGYARDRENRIICFDCCGKNDADMMRNLKPGEKTDGLYLVKRDNGHGAILNYLENWCGTFSQLVYVWKTINNWGYPVYHFENNLGPVPFYGRLTGDNKQCVDFVQRKVNSNVGTVNEFVSYLAKGE